MPRQDARKNRFIKRKRRDRQEYGRQWYLKLLHGSPSTWARTMLASVCKRVDR